MYVLNACGSPSQVFFNAAVTKLCCRAVCVIISVTVVVCLWHRSIHLSNNSVQKYFACAPNRSDKLPAENMWSSAEFEEFLRFASWNLFVIY